MANGKIAPERITKPLQLLGAWLAGLILINGSFLSAAVAVQEPTWLQGTLILASIVNVPVFLVCLFLLQTRFRPEMQEDEYYSKYLERNTGKIVTTSLTDARIEELRAEIVSREERYIEATARIEEALQRSMLSPSGRSWAEADDGDIPEVRPSLSLMRFALETDRVHRGATQSELVVQINNLLPEYKRLRDTLSQSGVAIGPDFGSTSSKPELPKRRIIGFGFDVPATTLRDIVHIAMNHGFNEIHWSDQPVNRNHIYLGSYVYQFPHSPQPVPLAEVLPTLESEGCDLDDLIFQIDATRLRLIQGNEDAN